MSKVTFFKTQFPTDDVIEIAPARFSEDVGKFVDHDLNIGWSLNIVNVYFPNKKKTTKNLKENEHRNDYRVVKKCLGAIQCLNNLYPLYRVYVRPSVTKVANTIKQCLKCSSPMILTEYKVKVDFYFSVNRSDCTMTHVLEEGVTHTQGSFALKHPTQHQLEKVEAIVKKNPTITANAAITGIVGSSIFENEQDIEHISPVLLNQHRTKYELAATRIRNGFGSNSKKKLKMNFLDTLYHYPAQKISQAIKKIIVKDLIDKYVCCISFF